MNKIFLLSIIVFFTSVINAQQKIKFNTNNDNIKNFVFTDSTHFIIADNNKIKKFSYDNSEPIDSITISKNNIISFCHYKIPVVTYVLDSENILYKESGNVVEEIIKIDTSYYIKEIFIIDKGSIGFIVKNKELLTLELSNNKLNRIPLPSEVISYVPVEDNIFLSDKNGVLYNVYLKTNEVVNSINFSKHGAVSLDINSYNNLIDIFVIDGNILSFDCKSNRIISSSSYKRSLSYGRSYSNNMFVICDEIGKLEIYTKYKNYEYYAKARVNKFSFVPELFTKHKRLSFILSVKNEGVFYIPFTLL